MNKRSARALAKARVKTLSDAEKLIKSGVIVNDVLSFVDENGIKSVFVYKSSDDEVQTNAIIDGLFERGVKVYIPKISGDLMRLSVISKKSKFVRNIFRYIRNDGRRRRLFRRRTEYRAACGV